jgi:hypothetical protein
MKKLSRLFIALVDGTHNNFGMARTGINFAF